MRSAILLLWAAAAANAQEATVGLVPEQLYAKEAKQGQGPAVVLDVIENTPAAKAGIRNGDVIVAVNGTELEGDAAMETLKANVVGAPGGSVKLMMYRVSEGRQFQVELTRVPFPWRTSSASLPFQFSSPANWRPEWDDFPLRWAPKLAYRGAEDLAFAPNFGDTASPNYHSYAFVLWLEGRQDLTLERLDADLLTYYKGISEERSQTRNFKADLSKVSVKLAEDGAREGKQRFHGDVVFYSPSGNLITLHAEAAVEFCGADHTAGVFTLSPQEPGTGIWKDLRAIAESFRCGR